MAIESYIEANTGIEIIVTTQAPDALPIGKNIELSTSDQVLVSVPKFEVPELVFGGSTTIEPGIGEIISPLILCNKSANTAYVDVEIYRFQTSETFFLVRNLPVPAYDTIPIPINGQFFASGDQLVARADINTAIQATLSYTIGQSEEYDVV